MIEERCEAEVLRLGREDNETPAERAAENTALAPAIAARSDQTRVAGGVGSSMRMAGSVKMRGPIQPIAFRRRSSWRLRTWRHEEFEDVPEPKRSRSV